jgi:predicted lipase
MKGVYNKILGLSYEKIGNDVDVFIDLDPVEYSLKVYFLGSNSKTDWKTNFDFPSKVYKRQKSCLKAHRGFVRTFKTANDTIIEKMLNLSKEFSIPMKELEVSFIGHSFGGAMAILAAEDFYFRFEQKPNIITFGSPKILANKKSVNYIKDCCGEIFQFAHQNDIVTYMPPMYRHIKKHKLGKFSLTEILKPHIYHLIYGKDIY